MHTGLHAAGVGLQRLSIATAAVVLAATLAYVGLVIVIVVLQAVSEFGH